MMANWSDKAATQALALAVADAAKIREESYDKEAATKASMAYDRKVRKVGSADTLPPDFSRFYRKTLEEAADIAAKMHGLDGSGRLIYLALDGWWNDALEWAEVQIKYGPKSGGQDV